MFYVDISMDYGKDRIVALVDMDCFYVQVEQRLNPALKNTPCVVAQYKTWKGGGIIAVSYEARAYGVTRNMWADDAKKLCPDLQVARVRESRGKADLMHYREASVEVIEVMSRFAVIERASIDEAYMDLTGAVQQRLKNMTENPIDAHLLMATYIQGYPKPPHYECVSVEDVALDKEEQRSRGVQQWMAALPVCQSGKQGSADLQLAVGALIVEEMRAAVEQHTGFHCSAGISHNKVLAKLACGLNKPNRQTVLPLDSVAELFNSLPISKIRNLGGKLGASITETLGIENMGELTRFSQAQLGQHFGDKTGHWLYDLCRGIDFEAVKPRQLPKSIGCSKNFPGKTALAAKEQVQHWLHQLALELEERLTKDRDMNGRVAKQLTVGVRQLGDERPSSFSRCCALAHYDATKISADSFAIIKSLNAAGNHQAAWNPPLTLLHISASKFRDAPSAGGITGFLSSDVASTQGFSITQSPSQSPSGLKTGPAPKPRLGRIQSLFQKAAEKQKQQTATEEEVAADELKVSDGRCAVTSAPQQAPSALERQRDSPVWPSSLSSSVSSSPVRFHNGISQFFQRKIFERSVQPPTSPLCKLERGSCDHGLSEGNSNVTAVHDSGVVAREHTCPEQTQSTTHNLSSEEGQEILSGETHSFFTPSVPAEPAQTSSYSADEDLVHCERCGKEVLAWNLLEHNDYHFARDLQNSFSYKSTTVSSPSSVSLSTPRVGGAGPSQLPRGKSKSRGQSGPLSKRPRSLGGSAGTLDSFFKRS